MKSILAFSFIALVSVSSFASETLTTVCRSEDGATAVTISYQYSNVGKFTGSAIINGVELKETNSTAFPTLEGWTTGDMDNYQTYQITLVEGEKGQEAVLISQDHVDRVGFFTTVTKLNCK